MQADSNHVISVTMQADSYHIIFVTMQAVHSVYIHNLNVYIT